MFKMFTAIIKEFNEPFAPLEVTCITLTFCSFRKSLTLHYPFCFSKGSLLDITLTIMLLYTILDIALTFLLI